MTTQPTAVTTRITTAIKTLLYQFRGAPVMEAVVASWARQAQELEYAAINVLVYRMLPNAEGANLDVLGKIVGELRAGRVDEIYRAAIASRIRINKSGADVEAILYTLAAYRDLEYKLKEFYPMSMVLTIDETVTEETADSVFLVLKRIKQAGVDVSLVWTDLDPDGALRLAPGDSVVSGSANGLGNDTGTTGGFCVEYER